MLPNKFWKKKSVYHFPRNSYCSISVFVFFFGAQNLLHRLQTGQLSAIKASTLLLLFLLFLFLLLLCRSGHGRGGEKGGRMFYHVFREGDGERCWMVCLNRTLFLGGQLLFAYTFFLPENRFLAFSAFKVRDFSSEGSGLVKCVRKEF